MIYLDTGQMIFVHGHNIKIHSFVKSEVSSKFGSYSYKCDKQRIIWLPNNQYFTSWLKYLCPLMHISVKFELSITNISGVFNINITKREQT